MKVKILKMLNSLQILGKILGIFEKIQKSLELFSVLII